MRKVVRCNLLIFFLIGNTSLCMEQQGALRLTTSHDSLKLKVGRKYLSGLNLTRRYSRICDLGCGSGDFTACVASSALNSTIVGVEPNPKLFQEAQQTASKYHNLCFISDDAMHYKADEPFDLILSNAVFHQECHQQEVLNLQRKNLAPNGELHIIMSGRNQKRVNELKEEGVLARVLKSERWHYHFSKFKFNPLSKEELEEMLKKAGFNSFDVRETISERRFEDAASCKEWVKLFVESLDGIKELSETEQDQLVNAIVEQYKLRSRDPDKITAKSHALIAVAKVLQPREGEVK